jgi:hypothetical protein
MISNLAIVLTLFFTFPFLFPGVVYFRSTVEKTIEPSQTTILDSSICLIDSIPDFFQRDTVYGGFPDKGESYCGPAAISNSIIWFSTHGYPELIDNLANLKKSQFELINQLASKKYIGTGHSGSRPTEILLGVRHFLDDHNYSKASIKYNGFRPVPEEFQTGSKIPDLDSAKLHVANKDAVWLNFGWYRYDHPKNIYTRSGGHWVTMVGYVDKKESDRSCLIIHDPETDTAQNEYLIIERIGAGIMQGPFRGLPVNAEGFYRFFISPHIYGIIDGITSLTMPKKRTPVVYLSGEKKPSKYH